MTHYEQLATDTIKRIEGRYGKDLDASIMESGNFVYIKGSSMRCQSKSFLFSVCITGGDDYFIKDILHKWSLS